MRTSILTTLVVMFALVFVPAPASGLTVQVGIPGLNILAPSPYVPVATPVYVPATGTSYYVPPSAAVFEVPRGRHSLRWLRRHGYAPGYYVMPRSAPGVYFVP